MFLLGAYLSVKGYSVMLLDEATSALDTQNTKSVMNAILNLDGITRIAVMHQVDQSILRKFDESTYTYTYCNCIS